MSIKVMTLVWKKYPSGGTELLALLALADWSDDHGRCFPSISAIAKKTRLSRSQAQRVTHKLIESGFVAVTKNLLGGAPTETRHYQIQISRLTGIGNATGSADAMGRTHAQDGSHPCADRGSTDATQTVIDPLINRQLNSQANLSQPVSQSHKTPKTTSAAFARFWQAYPRKVAKKKAEAIWKRLKPDIELVLTAIEMQKVGRQWRKGYIPYPTTWLNEGRWEDEPTNGSDLTGQGGTGKPWYMSAQAIQEKGAVLGLLRGKNELLPDYTRRILKTAGITPEIVSTAESEFRGGFNHDHR